MNTSLFILIYTLEDVILLLLLLFYYKRKSYVNLWVYKIVTFECIVILLLIYGTTFSFRGLVSSKWWSWHICSWGSTFFFLSSLLSIFPFPFFFFSAFNYNLNRSSTHQWRLVHILLNWKKSSLIGMSLFETFSSYMFSLSLFLYLSILWKVLPQL